MAYNNGFQVNNNGFPVNYMYPQQYGQTFQQQSPQGMTPPTIHADIVQINNEQEAWNYPVGQIMMTRDESLICIKSSGANGTPMLEVYERRTKPKEGPDFVTREEFEKALKELKGVAE